LRYQNYGVCVSEVEIDVITGEPEVIGSDLVYDCGKSLNPAVDLGQVEGGFIMGLGFFTSEEVSYDKEGKLISFGTWEYKPPSALDCPEMFNTSLLKNSPNPYGILSSKACGEPGVALGSSVVAAIEDAVTAAVLSVNPQAKRWACIKLPLLVPDIQAACGVQASQLTM